MTNDTQNGLSFTVPYSSGIGALWPAFVLMLIFGTATWTMAYFDPARDVLTGGQAVPRSMILFFAAITLIIGIEILFGLYKIRSGRPALVIDEQGIRGWQLWLRRTIRWDEFKAVYRHGPHLLIERKARSGFGEFSQRHTYPGSRRRWTYQIVVPLSGVEYSESEIRAAIDAFKPG